VVGWCSVESEKTSVDQETVLLFISVGSRRFEFEAVLHGCPLAGACTEIEDRLSPVRRIERRSPPPGH
jgi:hypothetical protein